jgi:hypothetical protein
VANPARTKKNTGKKAGISRAAPEVTPACAKIKKQSGSREIVMGNHPQRLMRRATL